MIEISSSRLLIRSLTLSDAPLLMAFEISNSEHFSRYAPIPVNEQSSLNYWQNKLSGYLQEFTRGNSIRFILFDKKFLEGPIIGICNFTQIFHGPFQAAYLGYKVDKRYEGKGFMGEALEEVCAYMFGKLNLHRIMANYVPSNRKSEKLLNRLGFEKEGYAKDYLYINGKWEDHILTSLTNPHWIPPR